ncbi:MAG TPA: preprotein translocase subunit SecE [Candidatus Acidoferrales bacterium]|nr:preprotein translocase subunit SecE [Candidatus Acidoferrales bacterium]
MWGFKSLLPCQFWRAGRAVNETERERNQERAMDEALKVKEQGIRGGGGGGNAATSALAKAGEYPKRWKQFLHDVRSEMAKVVWPSRPEVVSTTVVVIITVAFFGLFFLGTDSLFGAMFNWVLNQFK